MRMGAFLETLTDTIWSRSQLHVSVFIYFEGQYSRQLSEGTTAVIDPYVLMVVR